MVIIYAFERKVKREHLLILSVLMVSADGVV
jgi:hypothetical protein